MAEEKIEKGIICPMNWLEEELNNIRKTRTTRDLLFAVSQGACRDKKVLHKFISVNDSERVYPEGES